MCYPDTFGALTNSEIAEAKLIDDEQLQGVIGDN
jgi:hypothetical protein